MEKFNNRSEAGKVLAELLKTYAHRTDVIVLALPRGGVPVAYEIASALAVPLDVFIVRKLGVPTHEELAMGAIAMGGVAIFNEQLIKELHISKSAIDQVIQTEQQELARRELIYRGNQPFPNLKNKTIILVDDGIATGATMRAAVQSLKKLEPTSIIVAIPVAETATCEKIAAIVDKVICPLKPHPFYAVGQGYDDFPQTSDNEVHILLKRTN